MGIPTLNELESCTPKSCPDTPPSQVSNSPPGKACPPIEIAAAGTSTVHLYMKSSSERTSYRGKSDCIRVPLKCGGSLNFTWNSGTHDHFGLSDTWSPAGRAGTFTFLPTYDYSWNSVKIDGSSVTFPGANSTGYFSPDSNLPFLGLAQLGTYYKFYDLEAGTETVFSTNGGAGTLEGRPLLRVDRNGNKINYIYTPRNPNPNNYLGLLRKMTGDFSGVIPYFSYVDETGPAPIYKIFLLDTANSANSRTIYFFYQSWTNVDATFLQRIVSPNGCTKGYGIIAEMNGTGPVGSSIMKEQDGLGYTTYFNYMPNSYSQVQSVVEPEGRLTYYDYGTTFLGQETGLVTTKSVLGRPRTYFLYNLTNYIESSQLTKKVDSLGASTYYTWENTTTATVVRRRDDANGNITYFNHNALSFLISKTNVANGAITSYICDSTNTLLHAIVGPRFVPGVFPDVTYFNYNTLKNRISTVRPLGFTQSTIPDTRGRAHGTLDARGGTTYFGYHPTNGYLISRTDANNSITYFVNDSFSNQLMMISPRWRETGGFTGWSTVRAFDQLNRCVKEVNPLGQPMYFDYDSRGDLAESVDARGTTCEISYNGLRLATRRIFLSPSGSLANFSYYQYDIYKNKIAEIDANGHSTYFGYDVLDRIIFTRNALGFSSKYFYNVMGKTVKVLDARLSQTYYQYDLLSRKTLQVDALKGVSYYGYDLADNLVLIRDQRGNSVKTTIDAAGREILSVNAINASTYFGFDANDNLVKIRDAKSNSWTTLYDPMNHPVLQTNALGQSTYYGFDANGNGVKVRDARSYVTMTTFDVQDRPLVATDPLSNSTYFGYDSVGNLIKKRDARGNSIVKSFDALNRCNLITDALAHATYFGFDLVGNPITTRDARSNTTTSTYDPLNRRVLVKDALNHATYFGFDSVNNPILMRDSLGNKTVTTFDALNRKILVTDALANVTYYGFDAASNPVIVRDARGHSTVTQFDVVNRPFLRSDAMMHKTYFGYDMVNNLVKQRDANGNSILTSFDSLRRKMVMTDAAAGTVYFGYDAAGNPVKRRDQRGNSAVGSYDALNRITLHTDALAQTTYFGFDAVGNQVKRDNELHHRSSWNYNSVNRPYLATDSLGNKYYFGYDAVNNRVKYRNPLGNTSSSAYDAVNRVRALINPLNQTVYFGFDAVGNRVKEIDQLLHVTYFTYDALNRLKRVTDPLKNQTYYIYDATSNLSQIVVRDPNISAIVLGYDALNRKQKVSEQGATWNYFNYDAVGNATVIVDAFGTSRMAYDTMNRLVKRQFTRTGTSYFNYDPTSNRTMLQYPGASSAAKYQFDVVNRMTKLISPDSKASYFVYNAVSNLNKCRFGNNAVCYYVYDNVERVIGIHHLTSAGVPIVTMDYQRDVAGRIVKVARETDLSIYYAYDKADRLIQELWSKKSTNAQIYSFNYSYDAAGNRLKSKRQSSVGIITESSYFVYNVANAPTKRWVTPANVATYFSYTAAGNLQRLFVGTKMTYFEYSQNGFISKIVPPVSDGSPWSFGYDGLLNRVRILKGTTPVYYAWDGMNQLEERDPTGALLVRYTHGPSSVPGIGSVMEIHRQTATTTYFQYLHMDHQGSVAQVTDASQNGQLAYHNDAFGRQIVAPTGANTAVPNDLIFQTNWITATIGTRQYGISPSRVYDPELGIFLQRDPSQSGISTDNESNGNSLGIYSGTFFSSIFMRQNLDRSNNFGLYAAKFIVNKVDPSGMLAVLGKSILAFLSHYEYGQGEEATLSSSAETNFFSSPDTISVMLSYYQREISKDLINSSKKCSGNKWSSSGTTLRHTVESESDGIWSKIIGHYTYDGHAFWNVSSNDCCNTFTVAMTVISKGYDTFKIDSNYDPSDPGTSEEERFVGWVHGFISASNELAANGFGLHLLLSGAWTAHRVPFDVTWGWVDVSSATFSKSDRLIRYSNWTVSRTNG